MIKCILDERTTTAIIEESAKRVLEVVPVKNNLASTVNSDDVVLIIIADTKCVAKIRVSSSELRRALDIVS